MVRQCRVLPSALLRGRAVAGTWRHRLADRQAARHSGHNTQPSVSGFSPAMLYPHDAQCPPRTSEAAIPFAPAATVDVQAAAIPNSDKASSASSGKKLPR